MSAGKDDKILERHEKTQHTHLVIYRKSTTANDFESEIHTRNNSIKTSTLNPEAEAFFPRVESNINIHAVAVFFTLILSSFIIYALELCPPSQYSEYGLVHDDAVKVLQGIRVKNVNRLVFGTLNINSLPTKFEQLKLIIGNYLDILVIVETKLDASFNSEEFFIRGYTKPYRLDRNRNGGGVIIFIREVIPCKELNKHQFHKNVEGLFN